MFAQAYKSQPRKSGIKPGDVCFVREVFPKAQFVFSFVFPLSKLQAHLGLDSRLLL